MLRTYRRVWLSIIFLGIAAVPMVAFILANSARNAPIELGSTLYADDTSLQTTDDGTIPYAPPPRDIIVTTDRAGSPDILFLGHDGTEINLTDDGSDAVDLLGSWSMHGRIINFFSNRHDDDANDFVPTQVTPDGGELRTLNVIQAALTMFRENLFDWDPLWSPDGSSILWVSLRDLNLEIYRIPADAEFIITNATRLTNNRARHWFPAWSPDGSKIAYSSDEAGDENIYVMDMASGTVTQLTDHPESDTRPMWTRDGQQIIFVSERDVLWSTGELHLYIMDADGSNQRPMPDDFIVEAGQVWSRDSAHIAYISNREGNWHIYVSDGDGSNVRRVTQGEGNFLFPSWRP